MCLTLISYSIVIKTNGFGMKQRRVLILDRTTETMRVVDGKNVVKKVRKNVLNNIIILSFESSYITGISYRYNP